MVLQKEVKQQQLVMDVAVMIMNLNRNEEEERNHHFMDDIFLEDTPENQNRSRLRANLAELSHIVQFVYCSENTNALTEARLAEINRYLVDQ